MKKCFVVMPFKNELEPVYEKILRATHENMHTIRADDFYQNGNIMKDVIQKIYLSDIIIADLSARNANVFYELGITHAWRKRCIMITQSNNDTPFDLQAYRIVQYDLNNLNEFYYNLKDVIRMTIESEYISNPAIDNIPDKNTDTNETISNEMLSSIGLERTFQASNKTLETTINEAQTRYQFLGISAQFVSTADNFRDVLHSKRGCKFQFLLLNPSIQNRGTKIHSKREDRPVASLCELIRTTKNLIESFKNDYELDVEFRYYSDIPDFRLVILNNNTCYVGYYGCEGKEGVQLPQMLFKRNDVGIFTAFSTLWENRWESAIIPESDSE